MARLNIMKATWAATAVVTGLVSVSLLTGCSSAGAGDPSPQETTMASDKALSYFLDINCPVQKITNAAPSSSASLEEAQAWAASAQAAAEKAQSLMADPGAKWPEDIAPDIQKFSEMYYPPTIDYFKAIQQEKTMTGAKSIPRPMYSADGVAVQDALSKKLGADLGNTSSCDGR